MDIEMQSAIRTLQRRGSREFVNALCEMLAPEEALSLYTRLERCRDRLALRLICSRCAAGPGEPCQDLRHLRTAYKKTPHRQRWERK